MPSRQSSMEGESEYGFWHVLVRDVAYAQIPRAARAGKHVAAADWIEERAGERAEDLADVLAYHYAEAIELARSAGAETGELDDRALRFLMLAGERASHLDRVEGAGALRAGARARADGDLGPGPRSSSRSRRSSS